jgi:hypothetical protein
MRCIMALTRLEIKPALLAVLLSVQLRAECPLQFGDPFQVGTLGTKDLAEASGLAVSRTNPGVLWSHNDGGDGKLYAFTTQGELLAVYDIDKSVDDVEDIAIGPGPDGSDYLYIADIGSNDSSRDHIKIVAAPEPSLAGVSPSNPVKRTLKNVADYELKYPSGKFDAEGFLVDPILRELYVITKLESSARVFKVGVSQLDSGKTVTLQLVRDIDFRTVSGAAISRAGNLVALRREEYAEIWRRGSGESVGDALGRPGAQIPVVGPPAEANGEALSFAVDGTGYYTTSEGEKAPIYFVPLRASGTTLSFAGLPQVTGAGLTIKAQGCPGTITVERSNDLRSWVVIGTINLESDVGTFVDPDLSRPHFYRLRRS